MPLAPRVPKALLNRFATWSRLEPRCRTEDLTRGVQARTADPLWFIARQWQVGELRGEDAGSPVEVELKHSLQPVDCVEPGIGDGSASEVLNGVPLEVRIEARPLPPASNSNGSYASSSVLLRHHPSSGSIAKRTR